MHICFISHEYPKSGYSHGGVGSFISTLGKALVLLGHYVSVVGSGYKNSYEYENDHGVEIYRLPPSKVKGIRWYLNSRNINRRIDEINYKRPIDIIETCESGLAFIKKKEDIKYIIRLHGGHHFFAEAENRGINWWEGFQEKWSFQKADKIVGVGRFVMDHTAKYIDYTDKRGPVINNPINIEKFYKADTNKKISGYIFFAGTICEKKGIKQLIQAFKIIKNEIPNAHLYIAGRDRKFPDGKSYTQYLRQFIANDVVDSITFLGSVPNDDIPELIEKSEVCVFPSHMETFGLVAIEAMSMGKPVVYTKTGPGPEIISDGLTGLLCDPLDPLDIAGKTLKILKNSEFGLALGNAARDDVIKRFSVKNIVKQNLDFYYSLK